MRLKMRCDCTGEPPGEFTTTATVGSLEKLKALSIGPATEASASPGRSGVAMPIGPEKRSTGTTGPRLKKRIGEPLRRPVGADDMACRRPNSRPYCLFSAGSLTVP